MKLKKILAIALIVGGILALVYGGFSYVSDRHDVDIGPLEFGFTEKERVDVPEWVGILAIGVGAGLLLLSGRRS